MKKKTSLRHVIMALTLTLVVVLSSATSAYAATDGNVTKIFRDVDVTTFYSTTAFEDATAVYSISGNSDLRFQVIITSPNGTKFTDYIYGNGGKKAHTFSADPGQYKFTVSPYSGNGKVKKVTAKVYFLS